MYSVPTSKKPLIIFDLDGTLIDSILDLADSTNQMLAHFNKPPANIDDVRTWVGNGSVKLVERALTWAKLSLDNLQYAHELFLKEYAACQGKTVAYDGVTDGLKRLSAQGFILALCTNKPSQFLPNILGDMGWENIFACVIGGDSLPTKKPNPEPLLHICDRLGIKPSQAVMVGDSKNDVLAGQNADMTTLALSYGYNYGEPIAAHGPDVVFDDFDALVDFIVNGCIMG